LSRDFTHSDVLVYAESPDIFVDVFHRLLMRFWCQSDLRCPWGCYVSSDKHHLQQFVDGFLHNGYLVQALMRLLYCYRFVSISVDHHLVPSDRYFDSFLSKDVPKFLDEHDYSILNVLTEVWTKNQVSV
jgi:hypothetical protein